MPSVRIYARQIARFSPGTGRRVIKCALRRYRDGEFNVVRSDKKTKRDGENLLQSFAVRYRPEVSDSLLRDILDAHFNTPRPELDRSIEALDREIEQMMKNLPPFTIVEDREEEDRDEEDEEEEEIYYAKA